ncbi:MAG: hypothetical protein WCI74_19690, partial [Actinomycetes bacterium]
MSDVDSATTPSPNDPRFPVVGAGHVESWFLRANSPDNRQAIWLKATVLAPKSDQPDSEPSARVWAVLFDCDGSGVTAEHTTIPLSDAVFDYQPGVGEVTPPSASHVTSALSPVSITIADCEFLFSGNGSAVGSTETLNWNIGFTSADSSLAAPLSLLPYDRLITMGFPRS